MMEMQESTNTTENNVSEIVNTTNFASIFTTYTEEQYDKKNKKKYMGK